jgi:hypothetical protein
VTTTQDEKLDALRREMNAARDAWMALMGHGNTPELIAAAKVAARLEGEYRLAKMGKQSGRRWLRDFLAEEFPNDEKVEP